MLMLININGVLISNFYHFNTSHVNVNPIEELQGYDSFSNFNTSHVNVNLLVNICSNVHQ